MKPLIALTVFNFSFLSLSAHAGIRENGGFLVPSAAQISFISPGNGIDQDLKDKVEALVASYQDAGLVRYFTQTRLGMEGETTLCVQLNEIEASRRLNHELVSLVERGDRRTTIKFVSSCVKEPIIGPFQMKDEVEPLEVPMAKISVAGLIERVAYVATPSPRKARERVARSRQPLVECVSSGGSVAWTAPNDCPVGLGSFDDFKRRTEQRIEEMRRNGE